MTKIIEERREKIAEEKRKTGNVIKPKLEFDLWKFTYPLFVSVVTFGALLSQLNAQYISFAGIILSFQTGFFWQTILGNTTKTQS